MPSASLNSTFSEVQVSATKHTDQHAALKAFKDRAMTAEESELVDEMLEDYKESRDAMCNLTFKLSQMAAQAECEDPLVVLQPATSLAALTESLCRDRIQLNSKIRLVTDSIQLI